jgi:hypothetical protein
MIFAVLRIRDVYPGSQIRIFTRPGSRVKKIPGSRIRIRIKEFKYFNPKNCFSALGNMIRDVHPGSGSRGSKRHLIPNPQHWIFFSKYM